MTSREKKMLFHRDNALVHPAIVAIDKINELKFEHRSSSDLALSDCHLFPNFKIWQVDDFASNVEVMAALNGYFEEFDEYFYKNWYY
ncbi:hypothetical protein CEXT_508571 [Caerostris extrusa]|uniref:Uncharacterized protein n=1 Tax=Caerostris extrusa TaxID=172846 RepID=A0AAV4U7Q4_CAEEX|nr:hypothetical protein CEXT_508571 [Caerostris extrusa]